MDRLRKLAGTLIAAAAVAAFLGVASPCFGAESSGQDCGSTFVVLEATLGVFFDYGLRVGLEYRSPAGLGVEAAVGTSLITLFAGQLIMDGELLAILPLFGFGRSGSLDLAVGVPAVLGGGPLKPDTLIAFGGSVRLRFGLGSRWSLLVRAGAGYLFTLNQTGFHAGWSPTPVPSYVLPDVEIGAAFRL